MDSPPGYPTDTRSKDERRKVDATEVGRLPHPGLDVPRDLAFTPDGQALTYLEVGIGQPQPGPLAGRVAGGGAPRVVARPPGGGDTEANLSAAEKLRRERQRLRETGITQVIPAEEADARIIPLQGDLYLQRGDGPLERITESAGPEIDPKLTRDGSKVAFVRDDELFVLDLATTQGNPAQPRAPRTGSRTAWPSSSPRRRWTEPPASGGRPTATGSPTRRPTNATSRSTRSSTKGARTYSVETHRYPFAGAANARVRLGVVAAARRRDPLARAADEDGDDVYLARVNWDSPHVAARADRSTATSKSLKLYRFDVETGEPKLLLEENGPTPGSTCTTTCGSSRRRASSSGRRSEPGSGTWSSATATGHSSAS